MADTESLDDIKPAKKKAGKGSCKGLSFLRVIFIAVLLLVFSIFLHSDLFLDSVGGLWTGASDANGLTDKGIYVISLLLALFFMLAHTLVSYGLL